MLLASSSFYGRQGARAAALGGVCFDIYAICSRYIQLAELQPLAHITGGAVLLYEDTENAMLPQDLVRQVGKGVERAGVRG